MSEGGKAQCSHVPHTRLVKINISPISERGSSALLWVLILELIQALGKLKQEDCHKFKDSQGYVHSKSLCREKKELLMPSPRAESSSNVSACHQNIKDILFYSKRLVKRQNSWLQCVLLIPALQRQRQEYPGSVRAAWSAEQVPGQPGVYRNPASKI